MYYQKAYPETEFLVCPSDVDGNQSQKLEKYRRRNSGSHRGGYKNHKPVFFDDGVGKKD